MTKKRSKKKFLFIVVDGGDGAGKDTQAKYIASYYLQKGFLVRIRSHPASDNFFGRFSKKALEEGGKKGHLKAAFFYTGDVIRSLIKYYRKKEGEVIVFSRYLLGVCYLPLPLVFAGYNLFATILPTSKYFFFLDVNPQIAKERISGRGYRGEMFETLPKLVKMQYKMKMVTKQKNWVVINGDEQPKYVWNQIKKTLTNSDSLL